MLYLRIKHAQKRVFDLWVPLALTIFFILLVYASGSWEIFYDPRSGASLLSDKLLILMSALSGFFVAALAAIATFSKESLDKVMAGTPPTLRHGIYISEPENLTRRRFMSLLFGYLAFCAFIYTILLISAPLFGRILEAAYSSLVKESEFFYICKALMLIPAFIYCFLFFHIFTVTLLGLHYLSERMGRE